MAVLNRDDVPKVAGQILRYREREQHRMRKIHRYYTGKHDSVYTPRGARTEYNWIRDRSIVNFTPLVVSVVAENLHVDGYRLTPDPPPSKVTVSFPGTNGTPGTPPIPAPVPAPVPSLSPAAADARSQNAPDGGQGSQFGSTAQGPNGNSPQAPGTPQVPPVPQVPAVPKSMRIPTSLLFDIEEAETTSAPWKIFLANKMVSKQHGLHRSVAKYGLAYMLVLPAQLADPSSPGTSTPSAVMRPVSPRRMTAFYGDDVNDEWPMYAIETYPLNTPSGRFQVIHLYDAQNRYTLIAKDDGTAPRWPDADDILPESVTAVDEHGLGVCPIIRFQHEIDLDGETDVAGEVEPIIALQDQVNTATFNMHMAMNFASFRQRYVSGMVVADEDGRAKEPFRGGIDRLWVAEDADTKFGEFSQTELKDYLEAIEKAIQHMATMSQTPPYHLLGLVANLSAEALAAARDGLDRKIEELQATLEGPYKQTFQLSSHAAGDSKSAQDDGAQVIWRDTSARAFAATVDALGKLSQMLGVPATELWSRIPGVSAQDVARWKASIAQPGVLDELNTIVEQALTKNAAGAPGLVAEPFTPRPGGI